RLDLYAGIAIPALWGGRAGPVVVDGCADRARGGHGRRGLQTGVSRCPRRPSRGAESGLEGPAMGISDRWFRRRPSDDELREELEAHVAMRAEHDGVDGPAAKRRLGNVLRTREEMRRVWIADWWDALRQDAWFT